jgi:hypothetical protein
MHTCDKCGGVYEGVTVCPNCEGTITAEQGTYQSAYPSYKHCKKKILMIIALPIIIMFIAGIIVAIVIPGYIGMKERGRKDTLTSRAEATVSAMPAWVAAVRNAGYPEGVLIEVDSNHDGRINLDDLTNAAINKAGIINAFVDGGAANGQVSPWQSETPLYISGGAAADLEDCSSSAGQITLCYSGSNQSADIKAIHIVAADSEGNTIYSNSVVAE